MASKRLNITIDEETLLDLDAMANEYGMNRSECISFMFEVMNELYAWDRLQSVGRQVFAERYGREPEGEKVSSSMMLKAARECSIVRD